MAKNTNKRYGFHSIESIITNNPHTIKKLFIPSSRDDKRIHQLISLAEKFEIKYEISNKLKKDPEAIVTNSETGSFKDLKVLSTGIIVFDHQKLQKPFGVFMFLFQNGVAEGGD